MSHDDCSGVVIIVMTRSYASRHLPNPPNPSLTRRYAAYQDGWELGTWNQATQRIIAEAPTHKAAA